MLVLNWVVAWSNEARLEQNAAFAEVWVLSLLLPQPARASPTATTSAAAATIRALLTITPSFGRERPVQSAHAGSQSPDAARTRHRPDGMKPPSTRAGGRPGRRRHRPG